MELIERAGVLTSLQKAFTNVTEGEGHCLFISGEAGIGKTSLVKTFSQQQENCIIYQGACDALFTPRPLAPLYDIVWQVRSDLWPASHTIEERSELFSKFFHELSIKKERILIVFEDIHWADEATLDFINFFARRITKLKCLFILTYRHDEINSGHYLRNILGDLSPDTFTRIQLQPLSKEAVYKMAVEKGYDAENVYNISGGNPFYVTEILASYSTGVPDNIKDSILSVYNRQEKGTKNAWEISSVIPEGLEVNRFAIMKSLWDEGMDHCFALNIIVIKNDRVVFKHELYRRTIEGSLSPFKRIELNKKILEFFLPSFEEAGEIERIVHYAKNANANALVIKYAPLAAKQAASLGAHTEAAKLFLTAIEYSTGDKEQLLALYEAYAYECYLTNQTNEAIIYSSKSLELWKQKGDIEKLGNCLYFLSRLWWINDNMVKAEYFAAQAIEVLESQPSSSAKAMAYSLMSQLKMYSDLSEECIEWGEKAIALAKELSDTSVLSYALGNVGCVLLRIPALREEGLAILKQSLELASQHNHKDSEGWAYVNIGYNGLITKDFALTKEALATGIRYCEENNFALWRLCLLTIKAKLKLETGEWDEAYEMANKLKADEKTTKLLKIFVLTIIATIDMRRGNGEQVLALLIEAQEKALETMEPQRIMPALTAFLEYEWIMGSHFIKNEIIESTIELIETRGNIYRNSEFAFWLRKARGRTLHLKEIYEGYDAGNSIKAKKAAMLWEKIGCPYNEALALFESNDDDKRTAITIVQNLGGDAVYQKMKSEMRSSGIKKIPRGLRESTRTNPAQLTNRELDMLHLLQKGIQNKEIAGTLFISPKTADHHISSILFKLDVNSRTKAVNEALRLGILK